LDNGGNENIAGETPPTAGAVPLAMLVLLAGIVVAFFVFTARQAKQDENKSQQPLVEPVRNPEWVPNQTSPQHQTSCAVKTPSDQS
jgi:hypothetical protein